MTIVFYSKNFENCFSCEFVYNKLVFYILCMRYIFKLWGQLKILQENFNYFQPMYRKSSVLL